MHIGDYLGRRQIYSPDKLAIIDAGKQPALELSYRQMNERADRLANWLQDVAGVQKGDRVAILARDGVEHLDLFYACAKLGAIHTPFNWRLHWRELAGLIELTTPKALLFSDDFKSAVEQFQLTINHSPFTINHFLHLEGPGLPFSHDYRSTLAQSPNHPVTCPTLTEEDIACLLFTGGTTGPAQGGPGVAPHDRLEHAQHRDPRRDPQ
jgi:fatty-acyl-CoA synthase